MKSLRALFVLLLILPLSPVLVSCRPSAPAGVGPLSLPADGYITIISRPVTQSADKLHWKWSVLGERNWRKADAQGGILRLSDVYPLNSVDQRGGCNVWEADLMVERPTAGQIAKWQIRLHGSVGTTVVSEGTADLKGASLPGAVQIRQDKDAALRLPADTILAKIGDAEIRLTVAQ